MSAILNYANKNNLRLNLDGNIFVNTKYGKAEVSEFDKNKFLVYIPTSVGRVSLTLRHTGNRYRFHLKGDDEVTIIVPIEYFDEILSYLKP